MLDIIGVRGLGIDGWYSLCYFDYFFIIPLGCLLSELVKYLHIKRYLAAKIGTNFANKRYFHQVEMISVIKFCCHSMFPAVAQLARYYVYSAYFS